MSSPVISSPGLRGCVERLLGGDFRERDIRDLFFSMREEAGGSGLVSEVAHFLAHPTRTRGMIFDDLRDRFLFFRMRMGLGRRQIISPLVPDNFAEAMQANLRRIRARVLKQQLHLNRTEAQKVLDRILHKVALHGGRITQAGLTRQEMQAVQLLLSFFKGGSLFTDNDLFEDFCRALIKQNLLTGDEKAQLKRSKAAITLFALAAMHNKAVALGNGHKAELAIAPSKNQKDLSVFAFSDVANDAMGNISAALWVFETQLPIADFCDANVPPPERGAFFGDIEMTSDGRKLKRT